MSADVKLSLQRVGLTVGALAGLAGLFGAYFILPYRVSAAEKEIVELRGKVDAQAVLLARIDENVKAIKENQFRKP